MQTFISFGTRSKFRVKHSSMTYAAIALFQEPEPDILTILIDKEDLERWRKSRVSQLDFWDKYRTIRMWQGRRKIWAKARASFVYADGDIHLMIKGDIHGTS